MIPSYNAAATLGRAIASASAFDEVIVWIDGSSDYDLGYAALYPDATFYSSRNYGVQATRHKLLISTDADVIAYLDADDTRIDGQLSPQLSMLIESGSDFVYAPVRRNQRSLKLDPDPIKTILGQSLQTNGFLIQRRSLDRMLHQLGYTWRLDATLRHEYWFMFDMLRAGLRGVYYPNAVANYEPGLFSSLITTSDRLSEYIRFTAAVAHWLGDRWSDYQAIAAQVESSLRFRC